MNCKNKILSVTNIWAWSLHWLRAAVLWIHISELDLDNTVMQEKKTFTSIILNLGMWKSVVCFPGDGGWERPSTCRAIVAVGWRAQPSLPPAPLSRGRQIWAPALPCSPRRPGCFPPSLSVPAGPGRAGRRRKVSPAPRPPAPPRYEPLSSAPALPMVAERAALRASGPPRRLSKAQLGVPTARGGPGRRGQLSRAPLAARWCGSAGRRSNRPN